MSSILDAMEKAKAAQPAVRPQPLHSPKRPLGADPEPVSAPPPTASGRSLKADLLSWISTAFPDQQSRLLFGLIGAFLFVLVCAILGMIVVILVNGGDPTLEVATVSGSSGERGGSPAGFVEQDQDPLEDTPVLTPSPSASPTPTPSPTPAPPTPSPSPTPRFGQNQVITGSDLGVAIQGVLEDGIDSVVFIDAEQVQLGRKYRGIRPLRIRSEARLIEAEVDDAGYQTTVYIRY